jgi:hypothetical protein
MPGSVTTCLLGLSSPLARGSSLVSESATPLPGELPIVAASLAVLPQKEPGTCRQPRTSEQRQPNTPAQRHKHDPGEPCPPPAAVFECTHGDCEHDSGAKHGTDGYAHYQPRCS